MDYSQEQIDRILQESMNLHAHIETKDAEIEQWRTRYKDLRNAIQIVRDLYPETVFLPNSKSPDAKAADMARLTCDNILREFRRLTIDRKEER